MAVASGLSDSSALPHAGDAWKFSWPLIAGLVAFIYLMNASGQPLLSDPDTHWHIAVGDWMLANRTVPRVDVFSFTFAGQPWIAKEWLSQLLLTAAYHAAGWGGVSALGAAAVAATFALLLRLLLRDLRAPVAILFIVAAFVMMGPHLLARPHILAFPLSLIWVAGLVRAAEERRAPHPLLLVAMLLWANMHGGFTLGIMLCGAFALDALVGARDGSERKALFVAWLKFGVASALVACTSRPMVPESILVTLRIFDIGDALSMIAEWKSPNFQNQPMQELILLVGLYLAFSRGLRLPLIRLLIVLGLVHLYLRYARNAELLAAYAPLAMAPLLARQWPSIAAGANRISTNALMRRVDALVRPAGAGAVGLALVAAIAFAVGMIRFAGIAPPAEIMPTAALDYVRANGIKGHVFNSYQYGGPLIHAGIPTFIDGRGELFGGDFHQALRQSRAAGRQGVARKGI